MKPSEIDAEARALTQIVVCWGIRPAHISNALEWFRRYGESFAGSPEIAHDTLAPLLWQLMVSYGVELRHRDRFLTMLGLFGRRLPASIVPEREPWPG